MRLKSTFTMTGIAATALVALSLAAAAPAAAHTNNMYTLIANEDEQEGFATYSKTTGETAFLGQTFDAQPSLFISGIELFNEQGWVVGGYEESSVSFVQTWDHSTGEVAEDAVALFIDGGYEFGGFAGLDTLNDGTLVFVFYYGIQEEPEGPYEEFIAVTKIDPATGELTPLVQLLDALSIEGQPSYEPTGLATDPVTGITYVFLINGAQEPFFLAVDVANNTVGEPTLFQGTYFERGYLAGADFDPGDGSLYFNYANYANEAYELLKLGAPSTWVTAEPTYISTAPAEYLETALFQNALTIEHTVLANTGSELPVLAIVLVGTVAVLAGGVTVAVARRRSEAGTV